MTYDDLSKISFKNSVRTNGMELQGLATSMVFFPSFGRENEYLVNSGARGSHGTDWLASESDRYFLWPE